MKMFKVNGKKILRTGFSVTQIVAGLALSAALYAIISPRIGSSTLPAMQANVKEDIKNVQRFIEQYMANNDGSVAGLTWKVLIDEKIIKGGFTDNILAADLNPATALAGDHTDVYAPKYVQTANESVGAIKLQIVPVTNTANEESYNVVIDVAGMTDMSDKMEINLNTYAKIIAGDDQVNAGVIGALAAPGAITTAISTGAGIGVADGRLVFTIK